MTNNPNQNISPSAMPSEKQADDTQLLRLLDYLFSHYLRERQEEGVPVVRHRVSLQEFLAWCRDSAARWDLQQITSGAAVSPEILEYFLHVLGNKFQAIGLLTFWPTVLLADRESQHKVKNVTVQVILEFEDRTVPLAAAVAPVSRDGQPVQYTDGNVASVIRLAANNLSGVIIESGLDALYAEAAARDQ